MLRTRILLPVLVTTAAATVFAPIAAQAAAPEINTMTPHQGAIPTCQASSSNPAGDACFVAHGDHFYLHDKSGPGRVAVQWKLGDGSRTGIIRYGTTSGIVNGHKNKNLDEGKNIAIRFGVCVTATCDTPGEINFQGAAWDWTRTG